MIFGKASRKRLAFLVWGEDKTLKIRDKIEKTPSYLGIIGDVLSNKKSYLLCERGERCGGIPSLYSPGKNVASV